MARLFMAPDTLTSKSKLSTFAARRSQPVAKLDAGGKQPLDPTLLRCTRCKCESLRIESDALVCPECQTHFAAEGGKYKFVDVDETVVSDGLDRIKYFFKKYERFYNFLIEVISPTYPLANIHLRKILREEVVGHGLTAINLGSGYSNISPNVYNVDLLPYPPVDVVCDIENLPFKNDSVDYVFNVAVLEHVPYPSRAIDEMHRILKPGGRLYCYIPFIQGFHASPYDFQRFTSEGMKVQFQKFHIQRLHAVGPTSGMLWIVQEWVAMALSFGIKPLYTALHILMMLTTWPIKFLDVAMNHHPAAKNIATAFSVLCVKKS
jgi:SAM-dependent methyltransferase